MTVCNLTIEGNKVIANVRGERDVIFIEEDELAAMKRFNKMMEDLPQLIVEVLTGGAFEPLDEKDLL